MARKLKIIMRLSGFGFYSACIQVIWGIVFLMPADTFLVSPSYIPLSMLATETTWGVVFLTVGILHLMSIIGTKLLLRIGMEIVSIAMWLFIGTMFGIANPIGTGVWTYIMAAICSFITIVYLLHFEKGEYK